MKMIPPLRFLIAASAALIATLPVLAAAEPTVSVARWAPHDFSFTAKASVENPFAVRFAATVKAPDGRAFSQPGFFDGEGTWTVRVSATAAGAW